MAPTDPDSPDAYAATIAPAATAQPPSRSPAAQLAADATLDATTASGAGTAGAAAAVDDAPPLPEVAADNYVAEREIARGGMGRIVAAIDRRLGRRVAIKELLEPDHGHAERFRREALITARLQHPGIVPVYEAGRWPTGEPFYAMKLVGGRPLDRVIADARTLPDRLALLPRILAATEAIAYAHDQRVIHRDLKPANILVGDYGETIVVDWGLAKDLDAADSVELPPRPARASVAPPPTASRSAGPELTIAGAVLGTPAYMPPEQARGEPLDQRADVFALGAMLYHALAGTPPYDARTATDVIAAAMLGRVTPLAQRCPGAPADLVAIVERAMAQAPADRYASAGELAAELRRYLTGQLVGAHHYTALDRLRRFVRRHRAAVVVATVATLGFAVGGAVAVHRVVRARDVAETQRALATARKQAAEHLVDFMVTDFHDRLEPIGQLALMSGLATEVRSYYDLLARSPGGMRPEDVDRMAKALRILASAEAQSGDVDAALATWHQAQAQVAALLAHGEAATPAGVDRRLLIALTDADVGAALAARGKLDDADASFRDGNAIFADLLRLAPERSDVLLGAAEAHDRRGDLLRNRGKVDDSLVEYAAARTLRDHVVTGAHGQGDRGAVFALSKSHLKLASVHQSRGESTQALAEYRACAHLRETLLEADPDVPEWQSGLAQVRGLIADLERELGDLGAAIGAYQEALPLAEALVHRDPANTDWSRARGNMLSDLGFALIDRGDYGQARDRFVDAQTSHRALIARDPANTSWQVDLSRIDTRLGDAYLALGDVAAALASYEEGRAIRTRLLATDAANPIWQRSLAWSHTKLAIAYAQRGGDGDVARAIDERQQSLTTRSALSAASPDHAGLHNELAATQIGLGELLIAHGTSADDRARGATLLDAGVAAAQRLVDGDPSNHEWQETLVDGLSARARTRLAARDVTAARRATEAATTAAEAALASAPQSAYWQGATAAALELDATVDAAAGDPAEVAAHRARALGLLDGLARSSRLAAFRRPLYRRLGGAP